MSRRETFLSMALTEGGVSLLPPESSRGCMETLTLMPGNLVRGINGDVWDTQLHGPKRYCLHVVGQDRYSPAFEGLQLGTKVWVQCASYLTVSLASPTTELHLERPPVPNSVLYRQMDGCLKSVKTVEGCKVKLPSTVSAGFLMYRPALVMALRQFVLKTDEWGGVVSWTLDLEEV